MKKMASLLLIVLFPLSLLHAQIQIDWQQSYGSLGEDIPYSMVQTENGILVAGQAWSSDGLVTVELAPDKGWLLEIDGQGTVTGQQSPSLLPVWTGVPANSGSGLYLMGFNNNTVGSYYQYLSVTRQDASGDVQFERKLSGGNFPVIPFLKGQGACATSDGGMVGYCTVYGSGGDVSSHYGDFDAWLFKVSAEGELLWETTLGTSGTEYPSGLLCESDNSVLALISGKTRGGGPLTDCNHDTESYDGIVARLDANGNVVWNQSRCYGGSGSEIISQAIELQDGHLFLGSTTSDDGVLVDAGFHQDPDGGRWNDIWLMRTDTEGNVLWSRSYGGSKEETAVKAFLNADGGLTVFGMSRSADGDVLSAASLQDPWMPSVQRVWVFRTDSDGQLLWERVIGTYESDTPLWDVVRHNEKEYTLLAQAYSIPVPSLGDYVCTNDEFLPNSQLNYWILHITDVFDYSSVNDDASTMEAVAVHPNPVGDMLRLQFSTDVSPVCVEVFDVQERLVLSQDKLLETVNMTGLSEGVYTLRVTLDDGTCCFKKVIRR